MNEGERMGLLKTEGEFVRGDVHALRIGLCKDVTRRFRGLVSSFSLGLDFHSRKLTVPSF